MSAPDNLEIEYKYLIRYPDIAVLESQPGSKKAEIVQTYLLSENGVTARVRSWTENGETCFFKTEKKRISRMTAEEKETQITEEEYLTLLKKADPIRKPIAKTRYRIPFASHLLEIDIYPFWKKQAFLEIEISQEDEAVDIPSYLSVIRDVTGEREYKNHSLALYIPNEN